MKQVSCARCQPNTPFVNRKTNVVKKKERIKKRYQVLIVVGSHLFPFRTEKLSPLTPMVLRKWESRSPPFFKRVPAGEFLRGLF